MTQGHPATSRAAAVLLLIAVAAAVSTAAEPATTLIFVRHAEKASGNDPALTEAGRARAAELARVLADAGVDAVYASQFVRTRQTVEATAERSELEVRVVAVEGEIEVYARNFVDDLLDAHRGQTVLIAGHSNTVPALLGALGVTPPTITEKDYDDLFVVSVAADGRAQLVHLHYGDPADG